MPIKANKRTVQAMRCDINNSKQSSLCKSKMNISRPVIPTPACCVFLKRNQSTSVTRPYLGIVASDGKTGCSNPTTVQYRMSMKKTGHKFTTMCLKPKVFENMWLCSRAGSPHKVFSSIKRWAKHFAVKFMEILSVWKVNCFFPLSKKFNSSHEAIE